MEEIEIYTDGGCRGNPGLGSYAAIIYRNGVPYMKYGDCYEQTTNNEMEVSALLLALCFVNAMNDAGNVFKYVIYSDSAYAVNTYNDWLESWVISGKINVKKNNDLWKQIYSLKLKLQKSGVNLAVIKVKGHSGVPKNVEVDKLVNQLMDQKKHTDLMLKFPDLKYLEQNQLKNFSEVTEESRVINLKPLDDSSRIMEVFIINNLYREGDSIIAETNDKRIVINVNQLNEVLKGIKVDE